MVTGVLRSFFIIALTVVTGINGLFWEESGMQIIYQLARRCIVKVDIDSHAGNGIVWKIDDDGIIIASNRHLLMHDTRADITFFNNESASADIWGFSKQYDIGFVQIKNDDVSPQVLRDIYEAVPVMYDMDSEVDRQTFEADYSGGAVMQLGSYTLNAEASLKSDKKPFYSGKIDSVRFEPVFNTNVIVTECFSKAGMSGAGLFDSGARLLGMVSGGDVEDTAEKKEAEKTFCIPSYLIEAEYNILKDKR